MFRKLYEVSSVERCFVFHHFPVLNFFFFFQGHPRLVNAISNLYGPQFNRKLDPLTEVVESASYFNIP